MQCMVFKSCGVVTRIKKNIALGILLHELQRGRIVRVLYDCKVALYLGYQFHNC